MALRLSTCFIAEPFRAVRRGGLEPPCGVPGLQPGAVAAAPPTRVRCYEPDPDNIVSSVASYAFPHRDYLPLGASTRS
jgi:hypothetical protein